MDWSYIIILGLSVAVLALAARYANSHKAKPSASADSGKTSSETTGQALLRLAGAIEQFVERSSHPRELYEQADFLAAVSILGSKDATIEQLRQYVTGASWPLTCVALHVLTKRPERDEMCQTVLAQLDHLRPWPIYFVLRYLCSLEKRPPVGAPLSQVQHWWSDNFIIVDAFREYFEQRAKLGDPASFGNALETIKSGELETIEPFLSAIDHPVSAALRDELKRWNHSHLDRTFLTGIGRFWTKNPEDELLVTPDEWRERLVVSCSAILKSKPHHSLLVCGEPRVGKTSFLKLVSQLLEEEGWCVFESSAAELMAGQMYYGQLEERIRKIVTALNVAKKVVWYVPDLLQIAEGGRHQNQPSSILDQVSQAVNSGDLVLVSETSPAGAVRLFQRYPALKGVLELVRLQPMNESQTATLVRGIVEKIATAVKMEVTPEAVDAVLHLSNQYLGSTQLPGITVDLLKRAATHALSAGEQKVGAEDVLQTLSQLSGLPRTILDDNQRLDLKGVVDHFAKRVIGQDEAVGAIVDRIAMLKAGLVDPKRPIGVFLFAGPTGTGKTELAKTLADYLFGSADRMARLDMSELQTADSTTKILGSGDNDAESLAAKIRKQPFSVVLLDEFEKAHPNAWDLFLQVFDDGRLTDSMGRMVDFRHTIIILTTNLGATAHAGSGIGFARRQGAYSETQILQAVSRTFRPEFVNRLDKIIVFRPLSRDFMRQILGKELNAVLQRRGLRQRDWAVEYEDSAINFLLDRGFTTDMGARPLRRAIDEHLLAPLAATMVEHRYPDGDQFLFVRSNGKAIQVEFVDPDADIPAPVASVPEEDHGALLARAIMGAAGTEAECHALSDAHTCIAARLASPEWRGLKDSLSALISQPDVWQRPDRASVFSRYEVVDRVLEAWRTAERLRTRLDAGRERQGKISRELVARLALQLHLVKFGIDDAIADRPIDAVVCVDPLASGNAGSDVTEAWSGKLTSMYRRWSQLRRMTVSEFTASGTILHVTGFGAFDVLNEEAGLHVWEDGDGKRAVARVRVVASALEMNSGDPGLAFERLLDSAGDSTMIVRRYRGEPDMLVRDARKGWRSGKLDAVLAGNFDLIGMMSR
jgi:ATP-dependent Clp protease ATP-binding subunit ClpC